ncbi:hypothetical protein M2480_002979 [Parabacteroides sp. PFB2-12]|uniref:lipocalin family protein n=1 Tax=unclassified Parabacteroides TaxID=2649774 RepID=UPI0024754D29|nr:MULTISPECIES: lipocalin family protein [unclassified Parabacteroides]MDH6343433.1 hypothetical protein [Parabacteroides sp. PM6-13]MDH6391975.1 hypothetical protein [Parabacteroides sp. PFB2-12]
MKRYLIFYICLALTLSFSSCDDDKDNDVATSNIVGKWKLVEVKINGKVNNPASADAYYEPCDYNGWVRYNSDGTADEYDACTKKTYINAGVWSINKGILTLSSREFGIPITVNIIELSSTTFIYEFDLVDKQRLKWEKVE